MLVAIMRRDGVYNVAVRAEEFAMSGRSASHARHIAGPPSSLTRPSTTCGRANCQASSPRPRALEGRWLFRASRLRRVDDSSFGGSLEIAIGFGRRELRANQLLVGGVDQRVAATRWVRHDARRDMQLDGEPRGAPGSEQGAHHSRGAFESIHSTRARRTSFDAPGGGVGRYARPAVPLRRAYMYYRARRKARCPIRTGRHVSPGRWVCVCACIML
eukprot:3571395-Prymnesium_polylepis.1